MRFVILTLTSFCLAFVLMAGCSNDTNQTETDEGAFSSFNSDADEKYVDPIAVYLTTNTSRISKNDLAKHPEILVVQDLADFKNVTTSDVQLWIDMSSDMELAEMEELRNWLSTPPQKYFPLVAVGCNNDDRAFRFILVRFIYGGPAEVSGDTMDIESGFSIQIPLTQGRAPETEYSQNIPIFQQGYRHQPSVQLILDIVETVRETERKLLFFSQYYDK